jgi:hypothetical protein
MEPMSAHNRFEMPLWLKATLVAVAALNITAVLIGAALLWTNAGTDSYQSKALTELVAGQHEDQLSACERGNKSRVAEVRNLRADILVLRADRALLAAVFRYSPPSPLAEAYEASIRSKTLAIHRKRQTIDEVIESQASVAVRPGSAKVDCSKAYSLGR